MLQVYKYGKKSDKPLTADRTVLIALGGNLTSPVGSPQVTLRKSLTSLKERGAVIRAVSPFYHTPAFPAGNGPDYVNAAAKISAAWSPAETLAVLHAVETEFGRERVQRWGQRTLDLDLIAYDDIVLPDPQTHQQWRKLPLERQIGTTPDGLILPHPRVQDRAFVLVPLADVAPDWIHPVLGQSVKQLLDALPDADKSVVQRIQ